jgi:cob(I)alamin adenosyltransferase
MVEINDHGHVHRLEHGYIQVYTGDGKGKTTAALGLAMRAAGHAMRTYMGQFMKAQYCGEIEALRGHPFITIEQYGNTAFIRREDVTSEHRALAQKGLERARQAMLSGQYDIIVLDEINMATWFGLVTLEQVLALLDQKPSYVELILTGRRAPQEILDRADLITEMRQVKHYYEQKVPARTGIER